MWAKTQEPPSLSSVTVGGGSMASARDTCGWISGNPSHPLTCHAGQSCGIDTANSIAGCCWSEQGQPCHVSTRCLDKPPYPDPREAAENLILLCYGDFTPNCKTDVIAGDSEIDGFSLFICGTDQVTETVLRHTTVTTTAHTTWQSRSSSVVSRSTQPASTSLASDPVTPSSTSQASDRVTPSSPSPAPLSIAGTVLGSIGQFKAVEILVRTKVDIVPRWVGALSLLLASLWLCRKWRMSFKMKTGSKAREAPRSKQVRSVKLRSLPRQGSQSGRQTEPAPRLDSTNVGT